MMINDFEILILDLLDKFDSLFDGLSIAGATLITWFWFFITQFGDKFIFLGIMLLFYWCLNKQKGEKIAFAMFTSISINSLLKFFVGRTRPFDYSNGEYKHIRKLPSLDGAGGSSFPSGHSQNAATLFSSVALHERNSFTLISSIVIITLVPISRMYLGVHYPTDTIVGVGIGLVVSYLIYLISTYCYERKFIFYIGFLVLLFPFLLYSINNPEGHYIFMSFGLFLGFVVGIFIENKCINFTCNVRTSTKFLRCLIGVPILAVTYVLISVIKSFLPDIVILENIYTCISYSIISLLGFGIIPFIFKKQKR